MAPASALHTLDSLPVSSTHQPDVPGLSSCYWSTCSTCLLFPITGLALPPYTPVPHSAYFLLFPAFITCFFSQWVFLCEALPYPAPILRHQLPNRLKTYFIYWTTPPVSLLAGAGLHPACAPVPPAVMLCFERILMCTHERFCVPVGWPCSTWRMHLLCVFWCVIKASCGSPTINDAAGE